MNEIHCSACDAVISCGAQFCPNCGVRLIAVATPAVYVDEPRFSALAVIVRAIGILLIVIYAVSK
jgi:hypothetical protein